jgi:MOSC domain-containing protein YiiM
METGKSPRSGEVVSVNVGGVRRVEWAGRIVTTAIWKEPVTRPVAVRGVNLDGDDQADRRVHGGPDKAVYAYAIEDYHWWSEQLGTEVGPGTFGDNLTVSGLDLANSLIGDRWNVGSTVLEVAQPRLPCFKLGIRMGDATFVDRFEATQRFGAYLRIIEEGDIEGGDEIRVTTRPEHGFTITELGRVSPRPDAAAIARILSIPEVPETWRSWAERAQRRQLGA